MDVVDKNIRMARLHAERAHLSIDYRSATAEALAATGAMYDAALNMEVVEHVTDLLLFLQSCCSLVRPGGLMVVATINRTFWSYLGAILIGEHMLGWLPKGTHRWCKFPTPAELSALLERGGMTVTERIGMRVNPLTRRFRLSRFTGINYMLVAVKPV